MPHTPLRPVKTYDRASPSMPRLAYHPLHVLSLFVPRVVYACVRVHARVRACAHGWTHHACARRAASCPCVCSVPCGINSVVRRRLSSGKSLEVSSMVLRHLCCSCRRVDDLLCIEPARNITSAFKFWRMFADLCGWDVPDEKSPPPSRYTRCWRDVRPAVNSNGFALL